jgi:hypothetical protein
MRLDLSESVGLLVGAIFSYGCHVVTHVVTSVSNENLIRWRFEVQSSFTALLQLRCTSQSLYLEGTYDLRGHSLMSFVAHGTA